MNAPRNFIEEIAIDWASIDPDSYLHGIPALRAVDHLPLPAPVTFLVGENGCGKSTLLEAIAVAWGFNPEGGTKNYAFSTYDSHSELHDALRLVKSTRRAQHGYFLRAESFYNVATKEEDYADASHPSMHFHQRSHGEGFLALAQSQFRGNGLYLLDEPEAALSPQRQMTLLLELHRCVQAGAQFIIATHSPILLGLPGAQILQLDDDGIHPCAYEDTGSYQITKLFVTNPERVFSELFD
jgi:predicted ATPase